MVPYFTFTYHSLYHMFRKKNIDSGYVGVGVETRDFYLFNRIFRFF